MVEKSNIIELNKGKIHPQSIDLEEAVIGAMIIDKDGLNRAIELLTSDVFYKESNKIIFESISSIFNRNEGVDLLTVSSELKRVSKLDLIGGPYFVTKLTNSVVSTANIDAHARIVLQKFIQRELIRISNDIIRDSYEDTTDVFDLLDAAERKIYEITDKNLRNSTQGIGQLVSKSVLQK